MHDAIQPCMRGLPVCGHGHSASGVANTASATLLRTSKHSDLDRRGVVGRSGSPLYAQASTAQAWRVTSFGSGTLSASRGTLAAGADEGRLQLLPLAGTAAGAHAPA